jgi:PAT family beta-lactamase induction signal transducer AmpG
VSTAPSETKPTAFESLLLAMRSRRTLTVVLQSFASGLPLGLVWVAIPDLMRSIEVDIRVVGLITLAQAPWTFKVLSAPLMDPLRAASGASAAAGWRSRRSHWG